MRFLSILLCSLILGCGKTAEQKKPGTGASKKKSTPIKKVEANEPPPDAEDSSETFKLPAVSPEQPPVVEKIHRPEDTRPVYDDAKLAKNGFTRVATKRLILYSDLPAKDLTGLPELADELYPALEAYFGPLPPTRKQSPYQMTAFLMSEPRRFIDAGLLSENRVQPHEGWYRGNEFWWNLQPSAYYTRHLLLHEATHCFMHVMPGVDCPPWYVEGMAEVFGTHHIDETGKLQFGVLPQSPEEYLGWARISIIQQEVSEGRIQDLDQILAYTFNDFQKLPAYAWSWALCHYLNNHPRYQKPFRELAKRMMGGGFQQQSTELFAPYLPELRDEWLLFASQIQYGHDIERGAIEFQPGMDLNQGAEGKSVSISALRGWQSSRVNLVAGQTYQIHASGRVTLAKTSKPWISEPQGISIRYFDGQPLGRLLSCIRPVSSDATSDPAGRVILKTIPLGPKTSFVAPHSGTLYLRVNDAWNELAENEGELQVKIEAKQTTAR